MEPCGPSRQCHRASVAHHARARTLLPTSPDHHRQRTRKQTWLCTHRCGSAIPAAARFAWSYLQYACALICAGSCCSASLADGQRRSVEHHIANTTDPRRSREGPALSIEHVEDTPKRSVSTGYPLCLASVRAESASKTLPKVPTNTPVDGGTLWYDLTRGAPKPMAPTLSNSPARGLVERNTEDSTNIGEERTTRSMPGP